jgi:hypothetical protein
MTYRIPGLTLIAFTATPLACADPCVDDGLVQDKQDCPAAGTGSASESDTDATTGSATDTATASVSDTMRDSMSAGSSSMSASSMTGADSTSTTDAGGTLWCVDADMDGFGDPGDCTMAPDQPPGTVDNDDDCDDSDANTFPGAAPNDDADACMHDGDGDDWGDDDPGPGIDPGTDCDDDDIATFPGAASSEPDLCGTDADGDGWGDANPGGGGDPGADCFDGNADLNPDTMDLSVLVTLVGEGPVVAVPSTDGTAMLTVTAPLDTPNNWNPVSTTIDETGLIVTNNDSNNRLYSVDYSGVCDGSETQGTTDSFPNQHGVNVFCGIAFGVDGVLYGVRNDTDEIVEFDATTGQLNGGVALDNGGMPLDIGSCGMSFDCHTQQMMLADGGNGDVYTVDPATGSLTLLADTDLQWSPTGLAYDPVDRVAYVAGDTDFFRIAIDGTNQVDALGSFTDGLFGVSVSNVEMLPICL